MASEDAATRTNATQLGTIVESVEPIAGAHDGRLPDIAGFEMLGELGRGGMGVVYKARQIALNRLVAIKMLSANMRSQPEVLARFRTEAQAVARLQHPNIVQVFEVGEAAGRPYLALEFVSGGTLAQFLGRRPQPIALAADLSRKLAVAVEHAHAQGILHRDLKPGNVLLFGVDSAKTATGKLGTEETLQIADTQGVITPKITDFGLAKQINASDGPTEMGAVIGTPSYMAPEQASGVTRTFTPAVDVYALGTILYEMLTGRPPFLGESPTQTVLQVLSQEPVPPRELRPDCPRDLETIALKCLQKNPTKRYASAHDLAEDLRRFQAGEPIKARPAGAGERLVKWAKRRPTAAVAIVAGVALLIVSILYALDQRRHGVQLQKLVDNERNARGRAELNFEIARKAVKELLADVGAKELASIPQMDPIRRSLLEKAIASMSHLLKQNSDNPAVKREMAQVECDVAEIYEMLGENEQAAKYYRNAVETYRQLLESEKSNPAIIREYVLAIKGLATDLMDLGRPDESASEFQKGLTMADDLVAKFPGDPDNIHVRSRLLLNRGQLLTHLNQPLEGERDFGRARDDLSTLANKYPDRREFKESLAGAYNNLGVNAKRARNLKAAADSYQHAVDIYKDLVERYADNRDDRQFLAIAARNLGNTNWWLDKNDDALSAFETALEESRRLVKDFPGIPEYQLSLGRALTEFGEMLDYDHKPDGLIKLREAMAILEKLVAEQPKRADFHYHLGFVMSKIGYSFMRGKNWLETLRCEKNAAKRFRTAYNLNRKDVRFQEAFREEMKRMAQTMLELNQLNDVASAVDELMELFPGEANQAFELACMLGQCFAKAKTDDDRRKFGSRAIELLRQAAAGGAMDQKRLRNTPELQSLQSLSSFQELLKGLKSAK
jgi:tetratricopeptide (TPR) repeat protein